MIGRITSFVAQLGFPIALVLALFLINPFNLNYLFALTLFPMLLVKREFIRAHLDRDSLLLLLFSIVYALFYALDSESTRGQLYIAFYGILPFTFYLLGKYLLHVRDNSDRIFYILFAIFSLYSVTAIISVMISFLKGGFGEFNRSIPIFWTGEPLSATLMGSYLTFNMGIPAILIASLGRKRFLFQLAAIGIFTISLVCAIRIGSRTQLAIFLLSSLLALFYVVPRQPVRKNVALFFMLGLVVYVISTKVSFDLSADWLTNFADRVGKKGADIASGGGRTERWERSIENLFKKPLGWEVSEFGFSHNMWLDVLRAGSILSFVLLIIFTVRAFFKTLRTIRIQGTEVSIRALLLIYLISFFLIFAVEPIFEGVFSLFLLFCLFLGAAVKYFEIKKKKLEVSQTSDQ